MAKLSFSGLDELMLSMKQVSELPDDIANDMLQAGGEIVKTAQERKIRAILGQRSGKLANSVTVTPKTKTRKGGERFVTVYPKGNHHTYNHKGTQKTVRNADVLFVHEYGAPKRGISAKGIVRSANEESAEQATAAQAEIYDKWLQSKGL